LSLFYQFTSITRKKEFLSGRWVIKEAILKTLTEPLLKFKITKLSHLDINYDKQGKPVLTNQNLGMFQLSISHNRNQAIGIAIRT
jgi:holo-[acyl-carrier protein] synthase